MAKPDGMRIHILPCEAVIAAFIPICLLQTFYLVSQIVYFFSAFPGFLPENYTYAEYARRGFLELCAVSLVNLTVIAVVLVFTKHKKRATGKNRKRACHIPLCLFHCNHRHSICEDDPLYEQFWPHGQPHHYLLVHVRVGACIYFYNYPLLQTRV